MRWCRRGRQPGLREAAADKKLAGAAKKSHIKKCTADEAAAAKPADAKPAAAPNPLKPSPPRPLPKSKPGTAGMWPAQKNPAPTV